MDDPYQVLGVERDASPEVIRAAYRQLVQEHHPDRFPDDGPEQRRTRHARMASITAAYRMLNDPTELERFRRLQRRRERGRASAEPGRDGVHFTAADPTSGGAVEPAPGDPDFDYRKRAWREFNVRDENAEPRIWTARPPRQRRRRGRNT